MTDPRECIPEFRADFGKDRSFKPIDWAFLQGGSPIFFVEAKDAGKKLSGYDEQLGDYFAKAPEAKLGILTNGIQWRFFTDVVNTNVMDKEPFVRWDVLADEEPPFDFLTLLHKSQYNSQLIRTFAERKHKQNLLVTELSRLLEPSRDFIRLAVANIETRIMTEKVLEFWKPVVANALEEWVKQRMLSIVLNNPTPGESSQGAGSPSVPKVVTTQEELDGFSTAQRLLGPDRPIAYEDTTSYFKLHLVERRTWVICRFYFDRKRPSIWVPLPMDKAQQLVPAIPVIVPQLGWSCVNLNGFADLEQLGDLFCASWDYQRSLHPAGSSLKLGSEEVNDDVDDGEPEV